MKHKHLTSILLAGLLGAGAVSAYADDSTGPNNPTPKGTTPSAVGVPSGTGTNLPNGNTDGSATTKPMPNGSNTDLKKQTTNPEGSSMGGSNSKPGNGMSDTHDGSGATGGGGQ